MIRIDQVTKTYREHTVLDQVSFTAPARAVTALLGPNGAGKSTLLRIAVGLTTADSGSVRIHEQDMSHSRSSGRMVGALLDHRAFTPGRSARDHLRMLALAGGLPATRVDACLEVVGLGERRRSRAGTFSLGMAQRLGIATALLSDPSVLILDEPTNGLDPEGMVWLRGFLRAFVDLGRTILVSSHDMNDVAQLADHIVIIDGGRLVSQHVVGEMQSMRSHIIVETPDAMLLAPALTAAGGHVEQLTPIRLRVHGLTLRDIGDRAAEQSATIWELSSRTPSLETIYLAELDRDRTAVSAGGRP